jgi:hypothetical protein
VITGSEAAQEAFEVPEVEWPQGLRGRVGTESLLYAFAVAKEVLQCGSDEAWYPATRHLQQWCMIKHKGGSTEDVAMETGGVLVGPAVEEIAPHVESTWERGSKPTPLVPRPRLLALLRASLMPRRVYLFNPF